MRKLLDNEVGSKLGAMFPDVKLSELSNKDWLRLSRLVFSAITEISKKGGHIVSDEIEFFLSDSYKVEEPNKIVVIEIIGHKDKKVEDGKFKLKCPVLKCNEWIEPRDFFDHVAKCKKEKE